MEQGVASVFYYDQRSRADPHREMRVNGALTAVREWEDQERLAQDAMRAQNRSELGFRSDGFLEFGVGSLTSLNNFSLDDVFPSQPKRYALSNATHRQKTAKGPRGPTLRGPRTWMRHQNRTPALPEAVEELDRYYTGMQNPIGRSAGAGNWRSNSERVVLAISQPPEIQWNESQAGPEPAKQHNGSLLILKVSSGSVQNWRHVKDAGTGPPPTRHSEGSQPSSSAQQRRRPVDMPMVAGMGSSTAHVIVPKDEACEVPASSPGEEDKASSPKLDVLQRDSTTKESRREGATITFTVASSHPEPTSPRLASAVHKPSEESLHASPTSASHSKRSSARGLLGSRVGQTASSFPGRPLTEATKTWRNTPSWESTGWYSQGSLLDSATDAHVAPVSCMIFHHAVSRSAIRFRGKVYGTELYVNHFVRR